MSANLLEFLQQKLSYLPGKHALDLHALTSVQVQTGMLFPHCDASHLPVEQKITQQDFLATVSVDGLLTSAIEAYLFRIPSSNTAMLYVAKVDASGFAPAGSSITSMFTVAFMQYFIELCSQQSFSIHVFARGHPSYLFTNSQSNPKKRILSETKLVRWWRQTLAKLSPPKTPTHNPAGKENSDSSPSGEVRSSADHSDRGGMRRLYVVPGYTEAESIAVLPKHEHWQYRTPFDIAFNPLSVKVEGLSRSSLSTTVPSFPDDPKGRFMEDLARAAESVTEQSVKDAKERAANLRKEDIVREPGKKQRERESAELDKTSVNEFWQRMGFRSECATAVTGIFAIFLEAGEAEKNLGGTQVINKEITVALFSRLMSTLLAFNFATEEGAKAASTGWTKAILQNEERANSDDQSVMSHKLCSQFKVDNPIDEHSHERRIEETKVNVLQPRKKKKIDHAKS